MEQLLSEISGVDPSEAVRKVVIHAMAGKGIKIG
jgi:hypothetical protein